MNGDYLEVDDCKANLRPWTRCGKAPRAWVSPGQRIEGWHAHIEPAHDNWCRRCMTAHVLHKMVTVAKARGWAVHLGGPMERQFELPCPNEPAVGDRDHNETELRLRHVRAEALSPGDRISMKFLAFERPPRRRQLMSSRQDQELSERQIGM